MHQLQRIEGKMLKRIVGFFLIGWSLIQQPLDAQACVKPRCYEQLDPFEKTYVCPERLMHNCSGTYFLNEHNQWEKVRAVLTDCSGTYVLRIWTQCPSCGTCYRSKMPPEGMSCPLIPE